MQLKNKLHKQETIFTCGYCERTWCGYAAAAVLGSAQTIVCRYSGHCIHKLPQISNQKKRGKK